MPAAAHECDTVDNSLRQRHQTKSLIGDKQATFEADERLSTSIGAEGVSPTSTTSTSYHLNPIDDIFVRITTPERNFGVASLFWVEGNVHTTTILSLMERLVEREPKFRQRCIQGSFFKTARWVDMETTTAMATTTIKDDAGIIESSSNEALPAHAWSVKDQLHVIEMDRNNGETATSKEAVEEYEKRWIEDKFSEFVSRPFDMRLPMWRLLLVRGLSGNRSVIGIVSHHCMADGQGFARVMSSIMKPVEPDTDTQTSLKTTIATTGSIGTNKLPPVSLGDQNEDATIALRNFALTVHAQIELTLGVLVHLLLVLWYSLLILTRVTFFSRQSFRTHHPQPNKKRIAWTDAMSMSDIKTIRAAYPKVTLNDVMVACVERSFAAYMDSIDREMNDEDGSNNNNDGINTSSLRNHRRDNMLNLSVPKGLRGISDSRFENLAGIDYLLLPLLPESASTSTVIKHAHECMNRVKMSQIASATRAATFAVTKLLGPGAISVPFLNHYMDNSHGILTNVPGSPRELYFANGAEKHRIISCIMYPPALFEGSTGIAIASYNGDVRIGLIADDLSEYPDQARVMADGIYTAFQKILLDAYNELESL
ncbi:hypothetical protein BDF22DRAFT_740429 [Syncephalis plumigaleata]|nr:hypothetical protein BDF22DRAFT_740429 [Syncephalis plumigaleata]